MTCEEESSPADSILLHPTFGSSQIQGEGLGVFDDLGPVLQGLGHSEFVIGVTTSTSVSAFAELVAAAV